MGHFRYQNISGENVIWTVRQGGEVYGAPRLHRALSHAPNNVSPRNILVFERPYSIHQNRVFVFTVCLVARSAAALLGLTKGGTLIDKSNHSTLPHTVQRIERLRVHHTDSELKL